MFNYKFSKECLGLKISTLFVLKGWKNQEKEKPLGLVFDLHFYYILEVFSSIFFEFWFPNSLFSHTWAYLSILSIRIYFVGKLVCGCLYHQVVNLPSLWYPSSERWLCWYPSSERWLWKWYLYPSSEKWRLCWNPSSVRWLCLSDFEPYPSSVRWSLFG